jgi:hypothetical protein
MSAMGTGLRRCGETFGAIINLSYPVNHMNDSEHLHAMVGGERPRDC